ncbi:DUF4327 domain protein [Cyanobacterium sp. HL-69]|uniref:DUF4327 family protein n=1 Tax=Cyanobacterium sp. HL-69 TaxID=2054282 RepID=UPI000CA29E8B|nr:DUF4327 domain protein [Cyanobacterium sp. HL-69]
MSIQIFPNVSSYGYTFDFIRDEIRALVEKGVLSRHQPIYSLAQFIPAREWMGVEKNLEQQDFLLRDRICDLLGAEEWEND